MSLLALLPQLSGAAVKLCVAYRELPHEPGNMVHATLEVLSAATGLHSAAVTGARSELLRW